MSFNPSTFPTTKDAFLYFKSMPPEKQSEIILAITTILTLGATYLTIRDSVKPIDCTRMSTKTPQQAENVGEVARIETLSRSPQLSDLDNFLKAEPSQKMQEEQIASVETLFAQDRLIIRAMEADEVFEDIPYTNQCKLGSIGREMRYMESTEGLHHASATLIVLGKNVALYKEIGFLYDARRVNFEHIYGIDSNSSTRDDGKLNAGSDENYLFKSLDELANAIRSSDLLNKSRMNEVNGQFFKQDLVGLTVRTVQNRVNDAVLNLKIRSIQKLIYQKHGILLPIYKYNENTGTLEPLPSSREVIREELWTAQSVMKKDRPVVEKLLLSE